ncbi:MAG: hypothetical protein JSR77_10925 [Planctomycetes bacterium]|nr:hypothetical protein [Planctomycetota bacterium]
MHAPTLNLRAPRNLLRPLCEAGSPLSRSRRVGIILAATFVMSMADLAMTLTYATSIGMMEVNPIARAVMALGSPAALCVWKIATAGFGLGVLYAFRTRFKAEIAAWVCFIAMTLLMCHWFNFSRDISACGEEYAALSEPENDNPHWVLMAAR